MLTRSYVKIDTLRDPANYMLRILSLQVSLPICAGIAPTRFLLSNLIMHVAPWQCWLHDQDNFVPTHPLEGKPQVVGLVENLTVQVPLVENVTVSTPEQITHTVQVPCSA